MAQQPLATKGNYFHVYDFRTKPGMGPEFVRQFEEMDYSGHNPFHKTPAQVKDGVLACDENDPDHYYLIGEWSDIEVHRKLREAQAKNPPPGWLDLLVPGTFTCVYAKIVMSTPQWVLDKAAEDAKETA
jgi:hypothetical protein